MNVEVVGRAISTLPADDDHPFRTGPWRPNLVEYNATDLDVTGKIPDDLEGVYVRNTENPVHDSIGVYHPFDGDGMVHMMRFAGGAAEYRNRFVRTVGFEAEQQAGQALWSGVLNGKQGRTDGWGVHGWIKDASSTDVVVHAGRAITSYHECGEAYLLDPLTLDQLGRETWDGAFPTDFGFSSHPKVDETTGEMMFFNYGLTAPYQNYGVVSADNKLCHYVEVPLPGPRMGHDIAFTEHYTILPDFPMFWDPERLAEGRFVPKFFRDMPSRFAVIPRYGQTSEIRWFEADPTWVMHWTNAHEDGDEIVLDGFFAENPSVGKHPDPNFTGIYGLTRRYLDIHQSRTKAHRWRFNLATGQTKEETLSDRIAEFGMVNGRHGGRPNRFGYMMTTTPGMFLFNGIVKFDFETNHEEVFQFADGVFASETPMAPRTGAQGEDDGYLVTFVTDMNADRSECWIFSAEDLAAGPLARFALPERISSGTHACWAPASALGSPR